jgi:hypothetical protein
MTEILTRGIITRTAAIEIDSSIDRAKAIECGSTKVH